MFSSLAGNDLVKHTLRRLVAGRRVPNSVLFAGPDGVGKKQFAMEIARAYFCLEPTENEACGVCPACTRVGGFQIPEERTDKTKEQFKRVFYGGHGDLGLITAYKQLILVDAIRDLEREANFSPYESSARFFIIDDADKMNDQAANALLKTLEEPPASSHIFLITSRPDSLLPTIRSRCQTLWFSPLERREIQDLLINDRAYTHAEAELASAAARGSIARALSVDPAKYADQFERVLAIIRNAFVAHDIASILKIAEELNDAKNKDELPENLDLLESTLHDVWRFSISGDRASIVNTSHVDEIVNLCASTPRERLVKWVAKIETMRQNFIVNINRKAATDAMFAAAAAN